MAAPHARSMLFTTHAPLPLPPPLLIFTSRSQMVLGRSRSHHNRPHSFWSHTPSNLPQALSLKRPLFAHVATNRAAVVFSRAFGDNLMQAPSEFKRESYIKELNEDTDGSNTWTIKMLYDGECPLCMREVNMLQKRNQKYHTIKFVNICTDDYKTEENSGIGFEMAMGRIHAILRDGTILTDIHAFRRLYEEVGLGWVYTITKFEPIATIVDAIYSIWAKYRLPITGRPPLTEILQERRQRKKVQLDCVSQERCQHK